MKHIINAKTRRIVQRELTSEETNQRAQDAASDTAYKTPAAREARAARAISALFQGDDALLARLVREIAIDVAQLKGINPAQYRDELINRIK